MELKTARLTLLIDPNKKAAFESLCARQDRTASQVVRQLIRNYLAEHGVEFVASGMPVDEPAPGASLPPRTGRAVKRRPAAVAKKPPTGRRKT